MERRPHIFPLKCRSSPNDAQQLQPRQYLNVGTAHCTFLLSDFPKPKKGTSRKLSNYCNSSKVYEIKKNSLEDLKIFRKKF